MSRATGIRLGLAASLLAAACVTAAGSPASSSAPGAPAESARPALGPDPRPRVDPRVESRVRAGRPTDFWVDLRARADLAPAYEIADWGQRGEFVVDALREVARDSQADLLADLRGIGARRQSFWVQNTVLVRGGGQRALAAVSSRADVRAVRLHERLALPEPADDGVAATADELPWGITDIRADQVWAELGVRGEGVVVGSIDSGVQVDHPALADHYRGANGDGSTTHDHNWFDPAEVCGSPSLAPCDNNGHGSHTVGTMVGDDGADHRIGVAPGARWIAAKGCEEDFCTEGSLLASAQWMLAPTRVDGSDPDPALRPHVVNNSWGGNGGNPWFRGAVQAWEAAGMFPAFANGNAGFGQCGTVGDPAEYPESYGVGAYGPSGEIAEFSSLGPSSTDGGTKPDASAPGVGVLSSIPDGGYDSFSGTSMATPHLSGVVALMLSAAPVLVGDVASVRALLDETARDAPDTADCGGTPTDNNTFGEGRIDALAAVGASPRGETAVLAGRVTDQATGDPVPGAEVLVTGGVTPRRIRTDQEGRYALTLTLGEYDVEVSAYGWEAASRSVALTGPVTLDIELARASRSTVTGTVTDGSGQGWPLYARIDIDGYPGGPVFTDPATGGYQVELVDGLDYTLRVTSLVAGYTPRQRDLTLPAESTVVDVALRADATCSAPGYGDGFAGVSEHFDEPVTPPGWTVVDHAGTGEVWQFLHPDDPTAPFNRTGGDGGFAILDSDALGGVQDSSLVSPPADLSAADEPSVTWSQDLQVWSDELFDVDLSIDGGQTWSTVWHHEGTSISGPDTRSVPLPTAAGQSDVRVRFHYHRADWELWWQVDDVRLGQAACVPEPGRLAVGTVVDAVDGTPVDGARVSDPRTPEVGTVSAATPADPAVEDGFYAAFVADPAGELTVSRQLYGARATPVPAGTGDVVLLDLPIDSGKLVVESPVDADVPLDGAATVPLTLRNEGTAPASVQLDPHPGGFRVAAAREPLRVSAKVTPGRFAHRAVRPGAAVRAAPWEPATGLPRTLDDIAAVEYDGTVHVFGGWHDGAGPVRDVLAFDGQEWTARRPMRETRDAPAAAVLGDRIYVVGGFDDFGLGRAAKRTLEIYDPATDTWTRGPSLPTGTAGAGIAAVGGSLFVVGGCADDLCRRTEEVYRLDPVAGTWQAVAPYPEPVAWTACTGDERRARVYCAGGIGYPTAFGDSPELAEAYAYDVAANEWTAIAPLPMPLWASQSASANGRLVLTGGATDFQITDAGFAYSPHSNSWLPLPPTGLPAMRGAAACGLYRIGGITAGGQTDSVAKLPEYRYCGAEPTPWLQPEADEVSVPAGESVTLNVTLDAAAAGVDQPGTYDAVLVVNDDTPRPVPAVPVTMRVTPPDTWGRIGGALVGLGRCDTGGAPLPDATVVADGAGSPVQVPGDGTYAVWVPAADGPFELTVSAPGHAVRRTPGVTVLPGQTTTLDVSLRPTRPCADVTPGELELTVVEGRSRTAQVRLANTGAGPLSYGAAEVAEVLDPLPPGVPAESTVGAPTAAGWYGGADLPGGGLRFGHAQCDGDPDSFYAVGGVDALRSPRDAAWRFDTATNAWSELPAAPDPVESPTLVCEAGRLHLLGGSGSDAHHVLDLDAGTWVPATALPRPVRGAAGAAWDGRLYLVGGDDDLQPGGTTGRVDVYDLATGTWSAGPPMPVPAVGAGYAQAGRHLYVVGGWGNASPATNLAVTQRLDLETGTWSVGPAFAAATADLALVATDRALHALGGDAPGGGLTDATSATYRLATDAWPGGAWTSGERLPLRTAGNAGYCTAGPLGGEFWSVSGIDQFRLSDGETWFSPTGDETCGSMRADVPWLRLGATDGTLAADGSRALGVVVDAATLGPGRYGATLRVTTTDTGAPEFRVPVHVTVVPDTTPTLLLSLDAPALRDGVRIAPEDVFGVSASGRVTPYFDGSDVGLSDAVVDAFALRPDGALLLSFAHTERVPGIPGLVDDSDVVAFRPSSLGRTTSGTFRLLLDGSGVGLTTPAEDIDALDVRADGRLVVSLTGTGSVPGVRTVGDADGIVLRASALGARTAGTFAVWFDGNDVGLRDPGEDVDGFAFAGRGLALSTTGPVLVRGFRGRDDDVFRLRVRRWSVDTWGDYDSQPMFSGRTLRFGSLDVTAVELIPPAR